MRSSHHSTTQPAQSWQLLTFLFAVATALEDGVVAHLVLFTPEFLATIGFTKPEIDAWTGPIAAAGFAFGVWFVPFWGVLADRHGRKPLILRSHYIDVVAMVLAAFSHDVWLFLAARALTGFALGNTGLMYASLTEVAPRNRVALALGLVNGSVPMGALVGGLVGGFIVAQYGVHWLFGADAVISAFTAILLTALYRETFTPRPTPSLVSMLRDALRAVIHSPVAMPIFVVNFVSNMAYFFTYPYMPVRVGELVGERAAPASIGVTQGVGGVTTLLGAALWGTLAERVGHRRLLALLMLVLAVLFVPLYFAHDMVTWAVVWALIAAVRPSVGSLMFTIISLNMPAEKRGSVLSMIYLPLNLAYVVGPFGASFIARGSDVRSVFLVSALLASGALALFVACLVRTIDRSRSKNHAQVDR